MSNIPTPSPPSCSDPALAADALPCWTIERMTRFIAVLQRTRSVAAAARAAGMSRQSAYKLRARLPGHPFDRAWAAAVAPRAAFRLMTSGYEAFEAGSRRATGGDRGLRQMTGGDRG